MKALSIAWALIILALCSIPGHSVLELDLFSFDKLGHFAMFFVGALLWARTWSDQPWEVFAFGLAFSLGTEIYQGVLPFLGRSADPFDVVADIAGLCVGMLLAYWLRRERPKAMA